MASIKENDNLLHDKYKPVVVRPANGPTKPIPTVQDMIGKALPLIGAYNDLDNKQQVVALIDEVRFTIAFGFVTVFYAYFL